MKLAQKRAIYYAYQKKKIKKFFQVIKENNLEKEWCKYIKGMRTYTLYTINTFLRINNLPKISMK